jgi:MFS family permease
METLMPLLLETGRSRLVLRRRVALPTARARRVAVTAVFVTDGLVFGSWAARIPDVTVQVGATPATLGLVLLCISIGALAGMQVTGPLCARLGPGAVTALAATATGVAVTLPGITGSVPALAVVLLVFGAATGMLNVAVNAVGVQVERATGRPVVSSMHAGFSVGGLAGAGLTGLLAAVPVAVHLLTVGAAALLITAVTAPVLLAPDPPPPEPASASHAPAERPAGPARRLIVLFGVVAGCTAFAEGAVTDWGALYLRESLGAAPAVAAAGYGVFCTAMALGRLMGGALLARFGETALLVGGSFIAGVGALGVATATDPVPAVGAFAIVGLGLANVFPVALARAGVLGGAGGVALASTVGYTGLLGGPPLFGFLASATGIATGFATLTIVTLVAAALALHAAHAWPAARATVSRSVGGAVRPAVVHGTSALRSHAAVLTTLWPESYHR